METIKGTPVTDKDIQGWADEAERGYDVTRLRRRGRKPMGDGPAKVVPVLIQVDDSILNVNLMRLEAWRA